VVVVVVVVFVPLQLLSTIRCTADRSSVAIDYRPKSPINLRNRL